MSEGKLTSEHATRRIVIVHKFDVFPARLAIVKHALMDQKALTVGVEVVEVGAVEVQARGPVEGLIGSDEFHGVPIVRGDRLSPLEHSTPLVGLLPIAPNGAPIPGDRETVETSTP